MQIEDFSGSGYRKRCNIILYILYNIPANTNGMGVDAKRIINKVREEKKNSIDEKVIFPLVLSKNIKDKAIQVAKRNKFSLSSYLRKCIEELIIEHQDNDQPRIDNWLDDTSFKAWPIPQHSIRPSRFRGWTKNEILEYKNAIHRTLHALDQAETHLDITKSKHLDEE